MICQLKSTDAKSIKIVKSDLDTLEYNALVSHKLPIFVIQFLSTNECFLVLKPEDLRDIVKYLKVGEVSPERFLGIDIIETEQSDDSGQKDNKRKMIGSSSKSRKAFEKAYEEKFTKKTKSAT